MSERRFFIPCDTNPGVVRWTVVHDGVHAGFKLLDDVGMKARFVSHNQIVTQG